MIIGPAWSYFCPGEIDLIKTVFPQIIPSNLGALEQSCPIHPVPTFRTIFFYYNNNVIQLDTLLR